MLSLTPSRKMFAIILGAVSMCLVQPRTRCGCPWVHIHCFCCRLYA